jgi:uncharacterized membrane protein YhaH (DUF805 family)
MIYNKLVEIILKSKYDMATYFHTPRGPSVQYDLEQLILGRISRSRFWISMSLLGCGGITFDIVLASGGSDTEAIRVLFGLILLIPCIILHVKRCHDRDRSGWFVLVALVPLLNIWYFIETMSLRGTKGSNRFGRDPLSYKRARAKRRNGLSQTKAKV